MKLVRFVYYTAAIALFGMADGSGGPCSGTPCQIPNLFDVDLADLKSAHNQALSDFIKGALDRINGGNKDMDCYPRPITITVYTVANHDFDFQTQLQQARMDALVSYFKEQGLDPQKNVEQVDGLAAAASLDGTANGTYNDVDVDPPVIKMTSTPPENSKVKPGDKITIHATASERHADGHRSYPSGVKSLQLIANGTVMDSKDYGMKPPPCEVRNFEPPVYTVPKNPPEIVQLLVYAEDATGHDTSKEADFPTRGDWYGRLDWSVHQLVPTGRQEWFGHADLILDDDGQGGLTGTLTGTEKQKLAIEGCHGVTNWTLKARLTGTITTSAKKITINVMDRQSTRPETASCGTAQTGGDIFKWRQFNEMFQTLDPSADGNSYQSHHDIKVSNGIGDCTLIVRKLQQNKK